MSWIGKLMARDDEAQRNDRTGRRRGASEHLMASSVGPKGGDSFKIAIVRARVSLDQ